MNYFVYALFLSCLVAGHPADEPNVSIIEKNEPKPSQTLSVLETSDKKKSQQKRELYEDEEETKEDALEKQSLYKSAKPFVPQRTYSHLGRPYVVEIPVPYPVPVPREEYEKEFSHPNYHTKYDHEEEMHSKELLGGKYHKIVAAHYGNDPHEDERVFGESEHVLPGYLYHLHMKHQGVGGLYENMDSPFEYGSGQSGETLPVSPRARYQYGFVEFPKLDRSQYVLVDRRLFLNRDLEQSYLQGNAGLRKPFTPGHERELPKSQLHHQEGTRPFYPGHLLETLQKAHPIESRQVRPLGGNCERSELKNHEQVVHTGPTLSTSMFPGREIFRKTEQHVNRHSAAPELSVKLHQTLVALQKAEQEKAAIGHELHHIQHETDAKLQHGLHALEKANQEKHIIEEAVHHNIMQKEDNDVKLHQSLSALQLAEHQKQAIELELHKTQVEKAAKINQELTALEKAEQEKQMLERQLHKIAEHKATLNVHQKAALKVVKPENTVKIEKAKEEVLPSVSSKIVRSPALLVASADKVTAQLKKEQEDVPKEDAEKKQALASLLKQSSLIIGAIKEEQKDQLLAKTPAKI